jgi:glutamine amidotransferase
MMWINNEDAAGNYDVGARLNEGEVLMCRLYGFRANEATKVECTLVHAQNALMVQSRQDLGGVSHTHGWGVATYEDHWPQVERQAWAAYHGEHFRRAAARIHSRTVLAHVRRATVGPPALENTHPFSHGPWSMIHNGTLPGFQHVCEPMLAETSADHRAAITGVTDSEHLFRYLLSLRDTTSQEAIMTWFRSGVRQVIEWCLEVDSEATIGLNVILTDGEELVGSRWGRGLFYIERDGVYDCEVCGFPHVRHDPALAYRAVVVASEPISHENWIEVPDRALYHVTRDLQVRIERL